MATTAQVQAIAVNQIQAGHNDRTQFNPASIQELAASIQEHGLAQPITVRPIAGDKFEIVAGERRFRAVSLLGLETIEAYVKEMDDRQASAIMLVENLQRADLDPIDEGLAYEKRMKQFKLTIAQVADMAKVSDSKVRSRLGLLKLIPEVQHLIRTANLPLNYAGEMVGLDKNFQLIALRYFGQAKRPTITEFRAVCSDLLQKQSQLSMFDLAEFMTKPIEQLPIFIPPQAKVFTFKLFIFKISIEWQPRSRKAVQA